MVIRVITRGASLALPVIAQVVSRRTHAYTNTDVLAHGHTGIRRTHAPTQSNTTHDADFEVHAHAIVAV